MMPKPTTVLCALAIVLAGCGGDDSDSARGATATTTTEAITTTERESSVQRDTEVALRSCARRQADVAADLSLGFADLDAFDQMATICDEAEVLLDIDVGGAGALIGADIALRNNVLAEWQLQVVESGHAEPTAGGLTPARAALNWESELADLIDDL